MMGKTYLSQRFVFLAAALAVGAVGAACTDPVHDLQVKALGASDPQGIPDGEYHRAGQPCLVCHGFFGPAKSHFAVAGTIFAGPDKPIGADQVTVELVDSSGSTRNATTNCVGNFFIRVEDWDPLGDGSGPAFPLRAWLRRGQDAPKMATQIAREGSCSQCHKDPATFDSPGHIHLLSVEPTTPPPACVFSPIAATGAP